MGTHKSAKQAKSKEAKQSKEARQDGKRHRGSSRTRTRTRARASGKRGAEESFSGDEVPPSQAKVARPEKTPRKHRRSHGVPVPTLELEPEAELSNPAQVEADPAPTSQTLSEATAALRPPRTGVPKAARAKTKPREPEPSAASPAAQAAAAPAQALGRVPSCSASASPGPSRSSCGSQSGSDFPGTCDAEQETETGRRRKHRSLKEASAAGSFGSGFSAPLEPPPPAPPPPSMTALEAVEARTAAAAYSPLQSTQLAVLPATVKGLLDNRATLAQEVLRMKQVVEAHQTQSNFNKDAKEESSETTLRMPPRLHESLLHPDNESQLLARTGLAAVALNEDGLVILRAHTRKGLARALSQLRRVAYHCQWGCSKTKVAALLADKPAKPIHSMVVRLAATSSRLQSHEARLTMKVRKLRIGTQAGACQLVIDGIPGMSRRHCTITFEPEKGACYVQDLSTNGTYLNGKRLPRPPYKNPQDARVRLFHGDEMFFRLRSEDSEELGYVVNLFDLS